MCTEQRNGKPQIVLSDGGEPITPHSIHGIYAEPAADGFPRGPEEITHVAALKVAPGALSS
jgi:hypothetical protein